MDKYCLNRFDGIVYINLEHRTDRKEALLSELEKVFTDEERIHRIDAVYDPFYGHRGCTLSHLRAVELAKEKGWKNVLILEDDCYFKKGADYVDRVIDGFFEHVPQWDVFFLGTRVYKFQKTVWPNVIRVLDSRGAQAYVLGEHYYDQFLELLRYTYENMSKHPFTIEGMAHDENWVHLMAQHMWLCSDVVLHQRTGYSDIERIYRDRKHPERPLEGI